MAASAHRLASAIANRLGEVVPAPLTVYSDDECVYVRAGKAEVLRALTGASFACLVLFLPGCSWSDAPYTLRDSSGTALMVARRPVADSHCVAIAPVPVARAGGEASGATRFSSVAGVIGLSNGSIVVLDVGEHQVLVLDSLGRLIRKVGRRGSGPGEFRHAQSLHRMPNGGFAVYDLGLLRLVTFGSDGTTGEVIQVRAGGAVSLVDVLSDGALIAQSNTTYRGSPGDGIRRDTVSVMRIHRDGVLDTLARLPGPEILAQGAELTMRPFRRWSVVAVVGDALLVGDNAEYRIREIDPASGAVRRILVNTEAPVPISPAEVAREQGQRSPVDAATEERLYGRRNLPDPPAYFSRLMGDDQGNLWVRVRDTEGMQPSRRWHIYDASRIWRCTIALPEGLVVFGAGDSRVYGVVRHEDRDDEVRVYQVLRP